MTDAKDSTASGAHDAPSELTAMQTRLAEIRAKVVADDKLCEFQAGWMASRLTVADARWLLDRLAEAMEAMKDAHVLTRLSAGEVNDPRRLCARLIRAARLLDFALLSAETASCPRDDAPEGA